ncbi:MAG: hypothetical protein JXR96_08340 [Deltaproteobacteria bacterium]|nr:hypothetical protein [Deltaproteobacteria bacterium]
MRLRSPARIAALAALAVWTFQGLASAEERLAACKQRYHEPARFLANPDESVLIAGVIGWCRKNEHRLLWDEAYAGAARVWSGCLVESGGENERSLPVDRLRFEILQRGVTDAAILPYSARGPAEKMPAGMLRFLDEQVHRGRYTHFAVGATRAPGQKEMVSTLVLGRRPALIDPVPVCPGPGERVDLGVRLLRGYSHPRWLMTTPAGKVSKGVLLYEDGIWRGQLPLDAGRGEYTTEIVVNSPSGPEVAALFPLFAGVERPALPRVKVRPVPGRYRSPQQAEQALLELVNGARKKHALPPVELDEQLSTLARTHSDQLLFRRHAVHRTRETGGLTDRLRSSGYAFLRALENVSLSPSPESAHERFMGSPGHRLNVLDPYVTRVGIGVAMERNATDDVLAVCEVFVEPGETMESRAIAEKILAMVNARRAKRGRFALGLDAELCAMAQRSARRLAAAGGSADPQAEGSSVLEEIAAGPMEVVGADVRYFKTASPRQVLASPELLEEGINRLGVGSAPAGSRPGELWIALIFAGR